MSRRARSFAQRDSKPGMCVPLRGGAARKKAKSNNHVETALKMGEDGGICARVDEVQSGQNIELVDCL